MPYELTSLDYQRQQFAERRFLAMPLAGLVAWLIIGLAGLWLPAPVVVWVLYISTGSIAYLGILLSKFTGENFLAKNRPKNTFDRLFFLSMGMSLLVYAIALPFFRADYTSLPLSVGILAGLMWLPLSWIIEHWVGIFHGVARTVLVLGAWLAFPQQRFVVVPLVIVGMYVVTIVVLEQRWRGLKRQQQLVTS
ncbi:MAG: DUF7010 family protein [Janthinobacterium lividum]